ncbi:2-oxoacid:ferredoxin oxidoreductase subunit beta [Candidatus Woesearchaeota archaeon]|nr:2-oxoacid:ferredoxin oxidoreductase subunit beta [Candidatus Woesearchaeota archaeon]
MSIVKTEEVVWCKGCGLSILLHAVGQTLEKLNMNKQNSTVVSGIGCAARGSGYFDLDGINGLHGRAIPLAEGIKLAKPEINTFVFSGDGDLTGIGGNHLIHASRRNTDITVICANNEIYGMTGGQKSPLTPLGTKTMTSPKGNRWDPVNIQGIITSNKKHFYARTTVAHLPHLKKCLEEAFRHKGFSFVEVKINCLSNYGRRIGFKSFFDMLKHYKETFTINQSPTTGLKDNELGIIQND